MQDVAEVHDEDRAKVRVQPATGTPPVFREDRSRILDTTKILSGTERGDPKTARGPPDASTGIEPRYVSILCAANYTSESPWKIKDELRNGTLEAVKSGRRTLVVFESVKRRADRLALNRAAFAAPRIKRTNTAP